MGLRTAKNKRQKKVWHITDFRELFELSDDLRKNRPGPLTYTKSFVTLTAGSKEHDIKHFERIEELKTRQERHLLRSVFEDIKNWAGKKTLRHRGYLITTAEQPANYEYIASQVKMKVDELKRAMPILEEIGLIERVSMSVFQGNQPTKKAKKKSKSKAKKTPSRKKQKNMSGGKKATPDASGCVRMKPDASGTKRKSFKKPKEDNGNGKGNSKKEIKRLRDKDNANATEVPPPTTQPLEPQIPQKRGSVIKFTAPSELKNTERLDVITKKIRQSYNPNAKQFAFEIYQALALPWDPTSEMGRRELGCFASVWEKVAGWQNAGIPPPVLDELRARAIAEARKIGQRRQNRKKGAVWCTVFKNLETAYKRRA